MKLVKVILVIAGLSLTSTVMNAQPRCEHETAFGLLTNKIPDLTPEQTAKIEPLEIAHHKRMLQLRSLAGELCAHLRTLETADNPSLDAINKQIDLIGANRIAMMKEQAAFRFQVRALLTDKQKIAFDSFKPERRGRMHQRMHQHGDEQSEDAPLPPHDGDKH